MLGTQQCIVEIHQQLKKVHFQTREGDMQEIIDHLKKIPIFKDIADDETKISAIAEIMEKKTYRKGSYIFEEKEPGDELYIITSGVVRVCKKTLQDEEYTIVDLRAENKVFFGEIALMDHDVRSASILVLEDCNVLVMEREKFERLGDLRPEIGLPVTRLIAKIICERLRNANKDVILLFEALVNEIQEAQL